MAEELKPILLVSNEYDVATYKYRDGYNSMLGIQKITLDDICNNPNIIIDRSKMIPKNAMFIKHPFIDNKYVELSDAEEVIIRDKIHFLGQIVMHLGAKRISTTLVKCEKKGTKHEATVKSIIKQYSANLTAAMTKEVNHKEIATLNEEFEGELTQEGFDKARYILEKYHLEGNTDIKLLIEKRDPNSSNKLIKQEMEIEISSEYNNTVEAGLSGGLPKLFDISLNYAYKFNNLKNVIMKYTIEF